MSFGRGHVGRRSLVISLFCKMRKSEGRGDVGLVGFLK